MNKKRETQNLENNIKNLENKINVMKKFGISDKKRENLEIMKLKYETQLEEIQAE